MKLSLWRCAVIALLLVGYASSAEIRGKVVNARGSEPLGRVRVSIVNTRTTVVTADDGTFFIPGLAPGNYVLRVDAVGFWLQKVPVELATNDEVKEYSVALVAEGRRPTETVEVKGDTFDPAATAAIGEFNVTAEELRATATILAADPLRTVQILPGVTAASNNDYYAEFNVLGAAFSSVGIYLDDVQIRNPMHSIPAFADGASVSILSSETIESLALTPTAFAERYADATGAALDIRTREGARTRPKFRFSPSMMEAHGTGEGGFAHQRGSWLAAFRKSYLGYIMRNTGASNVPDVSFRDSSAKLTYDLTDRNTVDFYAVDGSVSLDRTHEREAELHENSLAFGDSGITVARLGWRFTQSPNLFFSSRAAFIRERLTTRNPARQLLRDSTYGEWVAGTSAVWSWSPDHIAEAGYDLRRLRGGSHKFGYYWGDFSSSGSEGTALRQGGYAQQSSTLLKRRVHLAGGLRWDRLTYVATQPLSPQASASVRVADGTALQFAFGRYVQFADFTKFGSQLSSSRGYEYYRLSHADLFQRATHYLAAVEQRLGDHLHIRFEGFHREVRTRRGERRFSSGDVSDEFFPASDNEYGSLHERARGLQVVLQRRSANRVSGWVGYTLNQVRNIYTPGRVPVASDVYNYRSDLDQRHTLNAFAMYRVRPTISLSGKWTFGSGYPIPAWLRTAQGEYFYSDQPAYVSMPAYARLDVRMDKTFVVKARKLTFSVEVLNATNHRNMRLLGYDNYDPVTKRVHVVLDRTLPITPSAGLSFEF